LSLSHFDTSTLPSQTFSAIEIYNGKLEIKDCIMNELTGKDELNYVFDIRDAELAFTVNVKKIFV